MIFLVAPQPGAAQQDQTPQEAADRGLLTRFIEDNLSGVSRDVTITGFRGALSSRATIQTLTVADAEGVWLQLEDITLDWNRTAVLAGRIEIRELTAARIALLRLPESEATPTTPEATPFALPELPVAINIGVLRADRIELGEPILGEEIALTLEGAVALAGGEGTASVVAERLDTGVGRFEITGVYSNATRVLDLNVDLTEAEDGIVARLLDLPGRPSVALSLEGTAPIDDYAATLTIATDGQERLTGNFGIETTLRPENDAVAIPERVFSLDVRGDVTTLVAPDFRDFFGTDVQLVVAGARDAAGALSLSELRVQTQSLMLEGNVELSPAGWPERLNLAGQVGAVDGDPVLLPVPGGTTFVEAISLDVSFDAATGDSWTGAFVVTDFERPGVLIPELELSGSGVLRPSNGEGDGLFTGQLAYAARGLTLDDAGLSEALGQQIAGDIALRRAEGEPFEITTLTLTGPGIEATAEAVIAGADTGFRTQSTVRLEAAQIDRFAALVGQDLSGSASVVIDSTIEPLSGAFDITLSGTTTDLGVGIEQLDPLLAGAGEIAIAAVRDETGTRLDRLDVVTPALRATARANLTSTLADAEFDLGISDASLVQPDLAGPVRLTGTASRDLAGVVTLDVDAAAPGAEAVVAATLGTPETGSRITTEASAQIDDLAPYGAFLNLPLSGGISAEIDGTLERDLTLFNLTVAAQTQDLAIGIAQADALLQGAGTLSGQFIRSGPESLRVEDLIVATPALDATATVAIEDGTGEAAFDIRLADAGLLVPDISGPATLRGTAARDAAGALALDLAATGPDAQASVNATIAPPAQDYAITGRISADIGNIAPYAALADQSIGGAIAATVQGRLLPDLSLFDVTLEAQTQDITTGIAQVDPLLRGSGALSGQIVRSGPESLRIEALTIATPALDAAVTARIEDGTGDAAVDVTLADAAILGTGLSGPAGLRGTARRAPSGAITLDLGATGPGAQAVIDATIAPPAEGYAITGRVEADIASLAPYSALAGRDIGGAAQATVEGSLMPDGSRFDLGLTARTNNLSIGVPAVDRLLAGSGTVAGQVSRTQADELRIAGLRVQYPNFSVTGDIDAVDGVERATFDARLADVGLFAPDYSGPATVTGTATRDATRNWQVSTTGTGPGGTQLAVRGQVARDGTLGLDVTGSAPLGLANAAIQPRRLEGIAQFNLSVNGPAALGSVSGTVRTAGARFSAPLLGVALEGISGSATLAAGRATIDLAAQSPDGGRVTVQGPVGLEPPFVADLRVGLAGIVLQDPELFQTSATGTVTVNGPLRNGARIAGLIDLGRTEIQVPSSGVGVLGPLPEVTHRGAPAEVRRTLERAGLTVTAGVRQRAGPRIVFPLDLTIRAPSRIFIRGRGLDAELGGEFRITGTTADIVPLGQFDLIRGRLDILQQRFNLTEGFVSLEGELIPFVRLVATTTAQTGTLVNIILQGPVNEPEVVFQSAPELPQDEVLAQLIFGRDISQITPLQAVQLAAAVGTLAGRGGGGVIDNFRQGLGLDDLDLATDDQGNVAVRAGAYLSENVYTDVTVGTDTTEINLNLDLTDNITVQGSAGTDGDTSLGIFFQRDY